MLDKYYTRDTVVAKCLDCFDVLECSMVIEPSAGNGAFIKEFKKRFSTPIIGYDIQPDDPSIIQKDFLTTTLADFDQYRFIICLGNPPFGRQNSLAVKFFNHCANFPNVYCIAMIFPKSFRKDSVKNRLNLSFHLEREIDIETDAFESADKQTVFDIPCIFQIWFRRQTPRLIVHPEKLQTDKFKFITNPENTNLVLSLRRVGFYSGKAKPYNNENKQTHYFIECKDQTIFNECFDYLNSLVWEFEDTVGARSISKQQFIQKINQKFVV